MLPRQRRSLDDILDEDLAVFVSPLMWEMVIRYRSIVMVWPANGVVGCPKCGRICRSDRTNKRHWIHQVGSMREPVTVSAYVPHALCDVHGSLAIPTPWAPKGSVYTIGTRAATGMRTTHSHISGVADGE